MASRERVAAPTILGPYAPFVVGPVAPVVTNVAKEPGSLEMKWEGFQLRQKDTIQAVTGHIRKPDFCGSSVLNWGWGLYGCG